MALMWCADAAPSVGYAVADDDDRDHDLHFPHHAMHGVEAFPQQVLENVDILRQQVCSPLDTQASSTWRSTPLKMAVVSDMSLTPYAFTVDSNGKLTFM